MGVRSQQDHFALMFASLLSLIVHTIFSLLQQLLSLLGVLLGMSFDGSSILRFEACVIFVTC